LTHPPTRQRKPPSAGPAEIDPAEPDASNHTTPSGTSLWSLFRNLFGGATLLTILWIGYCFALLDRRPVIIIERGDQADKETGSVASELREDMQEVLADMKEMPALAAKIVLDQRPAPSPLSLLPPPSPEHASIQTRKEKASIKDYTLDGTQAFLRQSLAKYGYQEDVIKVTVVHDQVMKHELLTVECEQRDKYFKFDSTFDLFKDDKWKSDVAEATIKAMGKFEPEVSMWFCATGAEGHSARELLRVRPSLLAALLVIGTQPDGTVPQEIERKAWKPPEWSLIQAEVAMQHTLSLAPNQRGSARTSIEKAITYLNSAQHDPSLSKFTLLQLGIAYWVLLDWENAASAFQKCESDYPPAFVYRTMAELHKARGHASGALVRQAARASKEAYKCPVLDSVLGLRQVKCADLLLGGTPQIGPFCFEGGSNNGRPCPSGVDRRASVPLRSPGGG
jgi:hypothetical protein